MKKLIAILLALVMVLALCACGAKTEAPAANDGEIPDEMTSADGKYPIAMVTDVGQLKDHSFNEGTWNGTKGYAAAKGIAYKYYQPANGSEATDDDRYDAMKAAVDNGAEIVVCCGFMAGAAMTKAAEEFPDVKWVYIDGSALTDADGNVLTNTIGITFKEEQCGYFAGYACVMDGLTKLGYAGGGGGSVPACCRYGYGFVQGANDAAKELGVNVDMMYSWNYGASFSPSTELETMLNGWYENGTECIFPCGGAMYLSCFSAAAANNAWALGVDSDQAGDSDCVLTSPLKGLVAGAAYALDAYYNGNWDSVGGTSAVLGVADGAISLPTVESSWRFSSFTVDQYNAMVEDLLAGKLVIDDQYPELGGDVNAMENAEFSNVTIHFVK